MKALHMLAASLSLAFAAPAFAEPPDDIGESVEALRQKIGEVGVSIAIVVDGKTTIARGWGYRKIGTTAPDHDETLLPHARPGKGLTVAAIEMLVDKGRD